MMGVVIALLVLLSAFFSATETAFSFVNKIRVQHAVENGDKKAEKVLWVIEHFDNALTAILICNNIVNLGCSSIATNVLPRSTATRSQARPRDCSRRSPSCSRRLYSCS